MPTVNTYLAFTSFGAMFAVGEGSNRLPLSIAVSVCLFIIGKLVDLFVKPYLQKRRHLKSVRLFRRAMRAESRLRELECERNGTD